MTHSLAGKFQRNSTQLNRSCQGPWRLVWLGLISLLSLMSVAAGPPVLTGSQPGDLRLYPKQIDAIQATQQAPFLNAPAALLADSDTQQPLLAINASQSRPNASTTKIMTALLTLERADMASQVVIQPTAMVEGSTMGLTPGEVVTVEDLLWGLLLNSANDAAAALAEHVAGSQADFVSLMNRRATELGMANTQFANPHGMDMPGHYSSAADLWRLAEAALLHPTFRTMVATQSTTVAGRPLWNRNLLLGAYPGVDGIKTGTTDLAGQCLVASATNDGHRVVTVVLGSEERYVDTEALLDHFYTFFRWDQGPEPTGRVAWLRGIDDRPYRVVAPDAPDIFLPQWQWPLLRTQPVLDSRSSDLNQPAGTVRWYLGSELLGETSAYLTAY